MHNRNLIQVFEHHILRVGETYNGVVFKENHHVSLAKLNALHQDSYFDVRHNAIKFKQFVGVVQVDDLTIEILPKIDSVDKGEAEWQKVLIEMLRVTKKLQVQKVAEADVSKQNIHLLDIYFEWFLNEVQLLIHQGLVKQYYKQTGNVKALKGKLEFSGHISKNIVHKERFYTSHQVYDKDHLIHQILAKALDIIAQFSKGSYLYSKCKSVQLDFPEVKDIPIIYNTFKKIPKSRKTAVYNTALSIARLIILNYAPNISGGNEKMLALLFDMNSLWEEYILVRLKQSAQDVKIYGQQSKLFWNNISIRPDIAIKKGNQFFIIDTKWKNIGYGKPSTEDLRQLYVYNDYWKCQRAMLLYPSNETIPPNFKRYESISNDPHHECGLGRITIFKDSSSILNDRIGEEVIGWFQF